ncbi:SRPBCC domain-containing protein [Kroppenstedtia pulmonis]|uniref:SRPBCC domain-containing protein n=2 Tax=Kroppenstedtia pulmonis TaxID=1380685 RepID=A0A7D4BRE7_9BACL|nr:SRPBCC domain-containing protein [Kroppenstedtia pulmonis]
MLKGKRTDKVPDIQKTVVLDAPMEKVWKMVSTSEGIAAWFMPNDFQPVVGNVFHLQSPFGTSPCKVLELDPPHRLSFAWDEFGWIVSFKLKERGDKTEFTLTHSGWKQGDEILPKAQEKSSLIRDRMDGGWTKLVEERLRNIVES